MSDGRNAGEDVKKTSSELLKNRTRNPGKEVLDANLATIVKQVGQSIAQAQLELDMASLQTAQMMSGLPFMDADGKTVPATLVTFGGEPYSLMELGFTPTFYQYVDTVIEVKMSVTITEGTSMGAFEGGGGLDFTETGLSASVNGASYSAKYQYSAEASSMIRTKLVPIPPPAILEERIRRIMDDNPVARGEKISLIIDSSNKTALYTVDELKKLKDDELTDLAQLNGNLNLTGDKATSLFNQVKEKASS